MNLFTALMERAKERRAEYELLRLDDHLLYDIGMTRSDVQALIAGRRPASARIRRG